ncbi:MAG: tRNA pseudouridine(38-40) synthase TruA [Clostridia bacterium]|nr:tRNA pseudouridine(38-40) synthase TruA [Clostridia bacterium]
MNYKLQISYDGTKYKGWQRNKKTGDTIQARIEETLSKYLGVHIEIIGAGRTDAGVHAKMQVANFNVKQKIDCNTLRRDLNRYLPKDIVINDVAIADDRFHSRFNAKSKTYIYTIWKADAKYPPLFERKYVYECEKVFDIKLMKKAAEQFLGKHDFIGFSSDRTKKSTVRSIEKIEIAEDDFTVKLSFTGDGFLYNMVRIIAGTLIEIAAGEMDEKVIDAVFKANNRELAGFTAPSCGLCLETVEY